jgi:hypothetical protein
LTKTNICGILKVVNQKAFALLQKEPPKEINMLSPTTTSKITEAPIDHITRAEGWRVPAAEGRPAEYAVVGTGDRPVHIVDFYTADTEKGLSSHRWHGDPATWDGRERAAELIYDAGLIDPVAAAEEITRIAHEDRDLWVVSTPEEGSDPRAAKLIGAEAVEGTVVLEVMGKGDTQKELPLTEVDAAQLYVQAA